MMIDADWINIFTCQRTSRIAGNYQKLGESHGTDSPLEPPNGTNLASILISKL